MRFFKQFRLCISALVLISAGQFELSSAIAETAAKSVPVPASKPVEALPKPDAKPELGTKPAPSTAPETTPVPETKTAPEKPQAKATDRIYQTACLPLLQNEVTGKVVAPVKNGQCEVKSPLEITAINTPVPMQFDQAITTNCTMTVALTEWAKQANSLAKTHLGSNIKTIGTGSHYQCRNVNNGSAGRVSEHAFGNALDIMSFTLTNGETTELAKDWNGSEKQKLFWHELQKKSCDFFMTVLGPDADSAHETNLHLDMGCHGASCTYRICQ